MQVVINKLMLYIYLILNIHNNKGNLIAYWLFPSSPTVGKSTKRGMALINPFPRRAVIFEFDRLK